FHVTLPRRTQLGRYTRGRPPRTGEVLPPPTHYADPQPQLRRARPCARRGSWGPGNADPHSPAPARPYRNRDGKVPSGALPDIHRCPASACCAHRWFGEPPTWSTPGPPPPP